MTSVWSDRSILVLSLGDPSGLFPRGGLLATSTWLARSIHGSPQYPRGSSEHPRDQLAATLGSLYCVYVVSSQHSRGQLKPSQGPLEAFK
jgi:hypothetical protein